MDRLPLSVLATLDPVLRDTAVMHLLLDDPGLVVVRHDILDGEDGAIRRLVLDAGGVLQDELVPLEHACLSCAVREDAVPALARAAADGRWSSLLLALPVSAESLPAARALATATDPGGELDGAHLSSVLAVTDVATAAHDLLGDDLLADRGRALTADDRRSVGEALAAQVGHADVVVTVGDVAAHRVDSDLLDHLRAPGTLRIDGLAGLRPEILHTGTHVLEEAEARLDPAEAVPSPGPTDAGVWTIVLESARPFHPERFLAGVDRLGVATTRSRGVFWVANRPDVACGWDGAGGQLSIGELEPWGTREPRTRLVLTGVGDGRESLREAFDHLLLDDAEMARGLGQWLGREDVLEPWLGERSPAW